MSTLGRVNTPAIVAGILAVLVLSACTSEYRKARSQFVSGCRESGPSSSVCNCVFDTLEDHYGEDQMIAMANGRPLPGLAEQVTQAAAVCRDE